LTAFFRELPLALFIYALNLLRYPTKKASAYALAYKVLVKLFQKFVGFGATPQGLNLFNFLIF